MKHFGDGVGSILEGSVLCLATVWQIDRPDGTVFRLTDHDRPIRFELFDYTPAGGFSASAVQNQDRRPSNFEIMGVIEAGTVTHEDLAAHLFDGAKITENVVDWRAPWAGAISKAVYYIAEAKYSKGVWEAAVEGLYRKLSQANGRVVSRNCKWALGGTECAVNLASYTFTTTLVDVSSPYNARSHFIIDQISVPDNWGDNDGNFGRITANNGANAGFSRVVRRQIVTGPDLEFWTTIPFPHDFQVGDSVAIVKGCDRLLATCRDKFNNLANYGGFPFVPSQDGIMMTPKAK